jgi:CubicO group peptidase (beta-lactamase class C family)
VIPELISKRFLPQAGSSATGSGSPLNGDTVFEIGSITKVFTALLLADMVARGEVQLTDSVEQYLPLEGRARSLRANRSHSLN